MDLQKLVDAMGAQGTRERSNYHATFGDLIDALKAAPDTATFTPKITGIGAYRGYYSDIALCTEGGNSAWKSELDYDSPTEDWNKWHEENEVKVDFTGTPKELGTKLESLLGSYFDGYKGGYNVITREKPLCLATYYGDCSQTAIVGITNELQLITKKVD